MRFKLALTVFFRILFDQQVAQAIQTVLSDNVMSSSTTDDDSAPRENTQPPVAIRPPRNDALTLLATLQREARFVDIVQEPLDDYSDTQIGAAARDVLRDCGEVIHRLFDLKPVVDKEEGAAVEAPAGYDSSRFRLTGNITGNPPFCGELVHHGWQASHCNLPQWSGGEDSALIVAPVELQVT